MAESSENLYRAVLILFFSGLCLLVLSTQAYAQHQIEPEVWIEMRKMYKPKGPAPTVEEDIAALAGHEARRAGPRLIDLGPVVLPKVHAALLTPGGEPRHGLRLLQVIGDIGDKSSVPVVLDLLEKEPKSLLRRDALLVLARLPATPRAAAFTVKLAADRDEPWLTRRMAFTWFGLHRDPQGRSLAEKLRNDTDFEHRAAAYYVLARLGDKTILEDVGRMLNDGPPANYRDTLLLILAEIASPADFQRLAPESLAWSRGFKEALNLVDFRAATPENRPPICLKMLRAMTPGHLTIAVRCLLESGHAGDLRPMAAIDLEAPGRSALIRNEIRKAGWRVIDTDTEFRIEPLKASR